MASTIPYEAWHPREIATAYILEDERMRASERERERERERDKARDREGKAESRLGYEGVAQAGHAEVSMATTGDKSTRNIPEYRQIKPHTHMCIRTYMRVEEIPTGNSAPKKFSLRPIYAAAACNTEERASPSKNSFLPFHLLFYLFLLLYISPSLSLTLQWWSFSLGSLLSLSLSLSLSSFPPPFIN